MGDLSWTHNVYRLRLHLHQQAANVTDFIGAADPLNVAGDGGGCLLAEQKFQNEWAKPAKSELPAQEPCAPLESFNCKKQLVRYHFVVPINDPALFPAGRRVPH